jgi:hypothetical protein
MNLCIICIILKLETKGKKENLDKSQEREKKDIDSLCLGDKGSNYTAPFQKPRK